MNAVARLWRALEARDWPSATAQLHPHAVIEWPHEARRFAAADDFVTAWRMTPEDQRVEVREIISESKTVAVLARVDRGGEAALHCAAFYELHDGRIARGTEVWVQQA